jgi:hypothetical protein
MTTLPNESLGESAPLVYSEFAHPREDQSEKLTMMYRSRVPVVIPRRTLYGPFSGDANYEYGCHAEEFRPVVYDGSE